MSLGGTLDSVSESEIWAAIDEASVAEGYDEYVRLAAVTDVAGALRQEAESPIWPTRTDLPLAF